MNFRTIGPQARHALRAATSSLAAMCISLGTAYAATVAPIADPPNLGRATTPITHVIVIIGENRSFDHVFATYVPVQGQTVRNLLSEGIVTLNTNKHAIPRPNFVKAHQSAAADLGGSDTFLLSPPQSNFPNNELPSPLTGGPSGDNGYFSGDNPCNTTPPLSAIDCALKSEDGLSSLQDYADLVSGGTGLDSHVPDTRISDVNHLPAGPF